MGPLGAVLKPSWVILGGYQATNIVHRTLILLSTISCLLGASSALLAGSWSTVGPSWGCLEAILCHLGLLGLSLSPLGALLEASWALLALWWRPLGNPWATYSGQEAEPPPQPLFLLLLFFCDTGLPSIHQKERSGETRGKTQTTTHTHTQHKTTFQQALSQPCAPKGAGGFHLCQ